MRPGDFPIVQARLKGMCTELDRIADLIALSDGDSLKDRQRRASAADGLNDLARGLQAVAGKLLKEV